MWIITNKPANANVCPSKHIAILESLFAFVYLTRMRVCKCLWLVCSLWCGAQPTNKIRSQILSTHTLWHFERQWSGEGIAAQEKLKHGNKSQKALNKSNVSRNPPEKKILKAQQFHWLSACINKNKSGNARAFTFPSLFSCPVLSAGRQDGLGNTKLISPSHISFAQLPLSL